MKSTFLCEVFVLRLSDNVSHLGVFFGLLSAFSAGATYVVIRFLGTAKANEFVWICWSFNEGSWIFWRLVSLLGLPDFAWKFGRPIGLQCCLRKHWVRSSSRHSRSLCPVNNWGHSGNFQCGSVTVWYTFSGAPVGVRNSFGYASDLDIHQWNLRFAQHIMEIYIVLHDVFAGILPSRLFSRPQMVLGLMIGFTGFVSQIAMTKGMQKAPVFELFLKKWQGMDGMIGGKWSENER